MMTFSQANKRTLMAGVGLILLTNAIVFAGVAYNRTGEPGGQATLTERELRLPYRYRMNSENTGISLQLHYRVKGKAGKYAPGFLYSNISNIDWLDKDKLASLGLDVSRPINTNGDQLYYRTRGDEKEVSLVLEYNGSAYQDILKQAEANLQKRQQDAANNPGDKKAANQLKYAKDKLESENQSTSRLFVIDAGLDLDVLRQQYPDSSKYILLKGIIGTKPKDINTETPRWVGYVKKLSNAHIHVPLTGHQVLEPLMAEARRNWREDPPRYSVKLNIGKRLEPWVKEVKKLEN